jgi:hypothetical protein
MSEAQTPSVLPGNVIVSAAELEHIEAKRKRERSTILTILCLNSRDQDLCKTANAPVNGIDHVS